MLKNILISSLLCSFLMAESFDMFLQKAIKNSPYLKSSQLDTEQEKENSSILTRYKNPSLELEYSYFDEETTSSNGFKINYAQDVRLWGVKKDKDYYAKAKVQSADAIHTQNRANFIHDISIAFTLYCEQKLLLELGDEELIIAKKIDDISKARYESGTISRGKVLQSQLAFEMIQITNDSLGLNASQIYYDLLMRAGINQEIEIDSHYDFALVESTDYSQNPNSLNLQGRLNEALYEKALYSNKIEDVNLYAEYESESSQSVARIGVSLPLALFNTRSQEKQIAQLKIKQTNLIIEENNTQLALQKSKMKKQREKLLSLKEKNSKILISELELLKMFQEGYRIANINLLELQNIQNRVIETKKRLINIKTALNQNAITSNYILGNYND